MADRLHLQPKHRKVLEALLREHLPGVEVWAYGSRVSGRSHDGSDLDLVLRGPGLNEIPLGQLGDFEEAVRESSIPFLIEARDWARLPERFHGEIERDHVVLMRPICREALRKTGCTSEWPIVQLGEVVDLLTGFPFESASYTDDLEAPRLLRGDNVAQGALRWNGAKRWPLKAISINTKYWLHEGDVVLAMDRPWIEAGLKYSLVRETDLPALLVQRVARLRGDKRLDTRFLYYVIGCRDFVQYVISVQTGTAVPHISAQQIKDFTFPLPPLSEQRAIAHVLGTLDDKIELNRRMNETLEAMARALFKSWFVDFHPVRAKMTGRDPYLEHEVWDLFPDTLDDEDKPVGWSSKPLDEIADFLNGLALQKFPASDPQDSLPVIKIAELRSGITPKSGRASREVPEKYIIKDGDFLFSWSGSLLAKFWTDGEGALNQHLFKVTSSRYPSWFFSYWVHYHLEQFQAIAASKATTMGHIQRGHLKEARTICPPDNLLAMLGETIGPLVGRMIGHRLESRSLAALRDVLLPKLISGDIRIRDAERVVEAVA